MAKHMRVESGVDRISALPDELLCHILSFLSTKNAVCTSVLSSRWRFLHNLISSIDIDINLGGYCDREKSCRFLNFVGRDLLCNKRGSIQRFCLKWHHFIDPMQINKWMNALMFHNIQELELCNWFGRSVGPHYLQLPTSLFSCETLVALKLVAGGGSKSRCLKIPAEASLPNLKVLHIKDTAILSDHFEELLSSCPVLDELVLDICHLIINCDCFKLNISSATLKRLTMRLVTCRCAVQIAINSPALEYLNYKIDARQSLMLLSNQSLTEVVIRGYLRQQSRMYVNFDYANALEHDVLKEINNIHSLQIREYVLRGLHYYGLQLPLFSKLTYLKVYDSTFIFDARCLEYLLAECIVLETLIVEVNHDPWLWRRKNYMFSLEQSRLVDMLCHLKIFEIKLLKIWDAEAKALMKLIEFFLNNANVLEKLTVLVRDFQFPLDKQPATVMELLTTSPRISKKCQVVFGEWRNN